MNNIFYALPGKPASGGGVNTRKNPVPKVGVTIQSVKGVSRSERIMRTKAGATLGLASAVLFLFTLLGVAFFYILQLFSGDRQLANAADAGARAAARQVLAVTITPDQVAALPPEFQGLGVDANGNVCPSGKDSNGNPALFNEIAYNNCAALAIEDGFKAAASGSTTAIAGVVPMIEGLNTFAQELTTAIQSSTGPANAATKLMQDNSIGNLPGALFGGILPKAYLKPSSLTYGYYTACNHSNQFFPAAFMTQNPTITGYVNQILSNTASSGGSNFIIGNQPLVLNNITNTSGFVDSNGKPLAVAFIAFQTLENTHSIDISSFSTTVPNSANTSSLSSYYLPPSAISLIGQTSPGGSGNSSGNLSNNGQPASGASNTSQNLAVLSLAVANIPQHEATLPSGPIIPTTGGGNTSGCAYLAIVNGGDFQTSLNNAGLGASYLQSQGYSNVNITPSTSIAFNGSTTDIFDVLEWDQYAESLDYPGDWLVIGTNSPTGLYNVYQNQGLAAFMTQAMSGQQNFPANNYNDIVDNANLSSTTASVPFVFLGDYPTSHPDGIHYDNAFASGTVMSCMSDFGAWIAYNTSSGSDALGHNASLDPLKSSGGSPALFAQNPNFIVPNTLISATSEFMQTMTLADALQIVDVCVFHDGQWVFTGNEPAWMDNVMPVIASNYGFDYLPEALSETKPNGYTAIMYAKAQVILMHAGLGLAEDPPALPSNPGLIYLPYEDYTGPVYIGSTQVQNNLASAANVSSGMLYFPAYDTQGNRTHISWPEPAGCPEFETPGTPLQLLQNMNLLNNNGSLNGNDTLYNGLLTSMLTILQQMNANITMNDLTTVLGGQTISLGQTLYLIYTSGQTQNDGLSLVSTLPAGTTYQPGNGSQASATYASTYTVCGLGQNGMYEETLGYNHTLVDTAAAPTSVTSYNTQSLTLAPYGDSEMHAAPYNILEALESNISFGGMLWPIFAQDTAAFWPSSGSGSNHGELRLNETIGPTYVSRAIN